MNCTTFWKRHRWTKWTEYGKAEKSLVTKVYGIWDPENAIPYAVVHYQARECQDCGAKQSRSYRFE